MTGIEYFHEHLDVCSQCANQPFNLCAEGFQRLKDAAKIENPFFDLTLGETHETQRTPNVNPKPLQK